MFMHVSANNNNKKNDLAQIIWGREIELLSIIM